jgi:hypothetical protein
VFFAITQNSPHPNPLLSKEREQNAEESLLLTKEKVAVGRMRWIFGKAVLGDNLLIYH